MTTSDTWIIWKGVTYHQLVSLWSRHRLPRPRWGIKKKHISSVAQTTSAECVTTAGRRNLRWVGNPRISKNFFLISFYKCIVPLGFLPWDIRVAFPKESQLQQIRTTQLHVHAWCVSVSIIYRNAHRCKCMRLRTGVYGQRMRVCT